MTRTASPPRDMKPMRPARSKRPARAPDSGSANKTPRPGRARLDVLLLERGLAPSRERAQALLLAGQVRVDGQRAEKPGSQIPLDAKIEITGETLRYSSRAGLKLEGALEDFGVLPQDKVCLDVGSSTGGFTDCLLQHGARRVYAVDVTTDQLDWKLERDERVIAIERNARYLEPRDIGELAELVTVDLSFISVTKVLPAILAVAAPGAQFLILIKPQFELERGSVGKGGIVRDRELHQIASDRVVAAATHAGLDIVGVRPSCLPGSGGNQEFFLHARHRG
jgi:23S rRNA (cytidine1920-2'-O)/16S rRNA (cytidine1409-2'-O)-methyltransferase